jgi:hypothetical protein
MHVTRFLVNVCKEHCRNALVDCFPNAMSLHRLYPAPGVLTCNGLGDLPMAGSTSTFGQNMSSLLESKSHIEDMEEVYLVVVSQSDFARRATDQLCNHLPDSSWNLVPICTLRFPT